jgi:hypothetical protein
VDGFLPELPYPGLRAFGRDESLLFFGRENCVDAMIDRLAATRFLAVLGASGSGKSSLVRTGLFDGLELGFFARAGARWKIVDMHPGGAPMLHLAAALARNQVEDAEREPVGMIQALLERGPRALIEWAGGGNLGADENLLVFVDQFEELFRYADYAAREEAEAFVALLLESARSEGSPIHVVITMRSEYLGACALIPGLAEQINAGFYLTPRMTREECRRAIEGPAAVMGFEIDPALVNQILNDMASFAPWEEKTGIEQGQFLSRRADQLPLMQHLLNRLWLRARERANNDDDVVLTLEDYDAVGGLAGALDSHGEEVLAQLPDADRPFVPAVFRALVTGPDPTNAVRRPCRLSDLQEEAEQRAAGGAAAAARIVDLFRATGCNFLQPGPGVLLSADLVIDISHESLIRQWEDLSGWLRDEARADANWRRLLMNADRHAAGEGELLSGLNLASLAQWWDAEQPTPALAARHGGGFDGARAFLDSSRTARAESEAQRLEQARRGRRRLVGTLVLVSTLLLVSVGTTAYNRTLGYSLQTAQQNARDQKSKADAAVREMQQKIRSAQVRLATAQGELLRAQADRSNAADEAKRLRDQSDQKAVALRDQQDKLLSAQTRATLVASVAGAPKGIVEAINYCGDHKNDAACQKLLPGHAAVGRPPPK